MRYIEENLGGEINFEEMSRIAFYSQFHFLQRKLSIATVMISEENNKTFPKYALDKKANILYYEYKFTHKKEMCYATN
jgi:hypothetical protein